MEFPEKIKALATKIDSLKESILTEEATKNAFILPFLQLLGYDIFNPLEVVPEFIADVGIKKGEKVDFAILKDKEPIIIIECKHWRAQLDVHNSQLFRYFHTTKAKFSILTNGIQYRFYTDLEENNKMDSEPFLVFDFSNVSDYTIAELMRFQKSSFDVDKIIDSASELKYSTAIKELLMREVNDPSEDWVRYFLSKIYTGRQTAKVVEQFKGIVKRSINQTLRDMVNERLQTAIKKQEEPEQVEEDSESKIFTTEEEIEGYHIVRAIVRTRVDASRIYARDTKSYFGILLDDNNRKPICRLHFNSPKKYIGLFDENKKEEKVLLEKIDDIYKYSERLMKTVLNYE